MSASAADPVQGERSPLHLDGDPQGTGQRRAQIHFSVLHGYFLLVTCAQEATLGDLRPVPS